MANFLLTKTPGENNFGAEWYNALDVMNTKGLTTDGVRTLTNKTLTNPTINGGELSGTFSGDPTLSGNITFSETVATSGAVSETGGNSKVVKTDASGNAVLTGGLTADGTITSQAGVIGETQLYSNPLESLALTGDLTGNEGCYKFGSLSGTSKWYGGVLAPNGKIYGIPYNSTQVLEIGGVSNGKQWWALSNYVNKF